ncbi:tetratricopeptide repeat protein [Lyngbya confervoides]|uniref:Tetratricopeptide repeat protein n=1 Tax=Lyngbya confervoides BDU141951 TaxID=1574623 RepID=A0ABD4T9E9_9CYAN|nr:tetratricopeptide repeat protein [Lyngbya confervoides]MCM1985241.1 tetratricopeptide repeat protein [Lyngbya confervoides BDU141951]
MDQPLISLYLLILLVLLGVTAWFVLRQILKTRRVENSLSRLQNKLSEIQGTTQEYFEVGSILLTKKLYSQAVKQFQLALKAAEKEQEENTAPIYNALGYAYFAQAQYDLAIRQYKEAVKQNPDYVTAYNNMGHAYEKKNLTQQALEAYETALSRDAKNATAKKRSESLRKRLVVT